MSKRKISFSLSESEIDRAIKELEQYKKELADKTEMFRQRVAEKVKELAQNGFNGAIVDDLTAASGGPRIAQVSVTTMERGDLSVVIANGQDAIWVEFGAGVYYNGAAGSSPHPKGAELGFTIGTYGKGFGSRNLWGFRENGELKLTHGTPAKMPMYNAVNAVCDEIEKIAREVWK